MRVASQPLGAGSPGMAFKKRDLSPIVFLGRYSLVSVVKLFFQSA
ncbi:hypothetical protein dsat_2129 [Alkalidesulfovibrio alkalitolerans DSM 16529]|uniref:Uncharacterized protein n=1 Tax=Alkalidesulfovibrio alkalitolerans DSM 16529 TaxID=1121439 RepID=S7USZ5_9BACT|nr:hypothetical protein [Alkalidesulfovibrio alkalitolerans]EPR35428.1 hypothetical protein dsat_2129 [Alkalidesulfovibrio alkalitolerans DSM 16529]